MITSKAWMGMSSFRVLVDRLVAGAEDRLATENVDGHPLDRADVDERVPCLWVSEVLLRHDLRVELLVLPEVLLLELRAVDLVDVSNFWPGSASNDENARTACAASARRSTRKRTRFATPDFMSR